MNFHTQFQNQTYCVSGGHVSTIVLNPNYICCLYVAPKEIKPVNETSATDQEMAARRDNEILCSVRPI